MDANATYKAPKGSKGGKGGKGPKGVNGKTKDQRPRFTGRCHWCNKEGHKLSECRAKERGDPKYVAAVAQPAPKAQATPAPTQAPCGHSPAGRSRHARRGP